MTEYLVEFSKGTQKWKFVRELKNLVPTLKILSVKCLNPDSILVQCSEEDSHKISHSEFIESVKKYHPLMLKVVVE